MNSKVKVLTRTLTATLALALLASPALVVTGGTAATKAPQYRKVSAPNVHYPVIGNKYVKDLKNFSARHRGTDIMAKCNSGVYATHPGTAKVVTSDKWHSRYAVRVVSSENGLVTTVAYLSKPLVETGQILQAGQAIGRVGRHTASDPCGIYFAVKARGRVYNPSNWLNGWVGRTPPVYQLFENKGFNVASFNILGASHTPNSRYGGYGPRLKKAVSLMNARRLDVVGTQEFQERQFDYFRRLGHLNTWGAHYWDPAGKKRDTENAIIWRKSTMQFVEGHTFNIRYFSGNTRRVPAVLLKHKATGRTAWFLNVHNPANVRGNAAKWRAQSIAIEKNKMIELRGSGRPVLLTGDFNDRQKAFCPLTADKLSITPNSIPAVACRYPRESSIDWIFAAGQVRFSSFARDSYPKQARIADHPLVMARAHLQD